MTTLASEVLAHADAALAAITELTSADLSVLEESQLLSLIRTMEKVRRTAESDTRCAGWPGHRGGTSLRLVTGLTAAERQRLEQVVGRRVGMRSDGKQLVAAYLDAMVRNAYARTTDDGPVPTSLTAERSLILIEISRQLNRVIEDFEIQALFRVPLSSARAMRTTLLATYADDADQLTMAWSLRGARTDGRRKANSFTGTVVVFESEDRRNAFVDNVERSGVQVEVVLGDDAKPWQVIVGDDFPKSQLPAGK